MNITTDRSDDARVVIIRIGESKLVYPLLSDFSELILKLIDAGDARVVIDMTNVVYVDSAAIGCLMDLYRRATQAGGSLKLSGVQKRVETMLTMTGTGNFIELHSDESAAVGSFGE